MNRGHHYHYTGEGNFLATADNGSRTKTMDQRSQDKNNKATPPSQTAATHQTPNTSLDVYQKKEHTRRKRCWPDCVWLMLVHPYIHVKHPPWCSLFMAHLVATDWRGGRIRRAHLLPEGTLWSVKQQIRSHVVQNISQQSVSYRMIHNDCLLCICCHAY